MSFWFGESWGAPVCVPGLQLPTPVGEQCPSCDHPIKEGAQGLIIPRIKGFKEPAIPEPWHLDCFLKNIGISDNLCRDRIDIPDFGFIQCQDATGQPHQHIAYRRWADKHVRMVWE